MPKSNGRATGQMNRNDSCKLIKFSLVFYEDDRHCNHWFNLNWRWNSTAFCILLNISFCTAEMQRYSHRKIINIFIYIKRNGLAIRFLVALQDNFTQNVENKIVSLTSVWLYRWAQLRGWPISSTSPTLHWNKKRLWTQADFSTKWSPLSSRCHATYFPSASWPRPPCPFPWWDIPLRGLCPPTRTRLSTTQIPRTHTLLPNSRESTERCPSIPLPSTSWTLPSTCAVLLLLAVTLMFIGDRSMQGAPFAPPTTRWLPRRRRSQQTWSRSAG